MPKDAWMTKVPLSFGLVLLLCVIAGCRGCNVPPPQEVSPTNAPQQNKNIETEDVKSLPSGQDTVGILLKPGHWYQANQKLTSRIQDENLTSRLTLYGTDRRPVPMFAGYSPISYERQLTLARNQSKNIRLQFFQSEIPVANLAAEQTPESAAASYIEILYKDRTTGADLFSDQFPIRLLDGYQYNLLNLSTEPTRYLFWRTLPCLNWPSQARLPRERFTPHRVIDLKPDDIASQIPDRLFAMTSISHIVINDLSLAMLSPDQQAAFLDWLHFGGTVVVNGPDALTSTESSFFRRYLPMNNLQTVDWTQEETDRLNANWTIQQLGGSTTQFVASRPIAMLSGNLATGSQWLPSLEGIVAERLVGQGRVVMTTFPMSDSQFQLWPSYDSLIHNAVLRKPSRTVVKSEPHDTLYAGAFQGSEINPVHSTRLRLWARDLDKTMIEPSKEQSTGDPSQHSHLLTKRTSLGAWSANSEVTQLARSSLQKTAGITVPKIETILKLLAIYIAFLVPINWLVFRLIGRVEWAWIAAPVISIVGAFAIARSVQLDVGFTRSENSYGVLECHPGHSRGLLTRYHALYTSLSTTYSATFDNEDGVLSPLPTSRDQAERVRRFELPLLNYSYAESGENGLRNNTIYSNTTGMLHSEEMVGLQGSYRVQIDDAADRIEWTHEMDLPLRDVGVLGMDASGQWKLGWVGDLTTSQTVEVSLQHVRAPGDDATAPRKLPTDPRWLAEWNENPILKRPHVVGADGVSWTDTDFDSTENLYIGPLLELFATKYPIGRGEFIALGWTDADASHLTITPSASQQKSTTLVLLHVSPPTLPAEVRPDQYVYPQVEEATKPVFSDIEG